MISGKMAEDEGAQNVVILNLIQEGQHHQDADPDGGLQIDENEEYAANIIQSSIDEVENQ